MINLSDIQIKKRKFDDGSLEFKATLEIRSYHRLSPMTMSEIKDIEALMAHVQEHLQQQIWHKLYGDLRDSCFNLIHEAKAMPHDPSFSGVGLARAIMDLENKLK